MENSLIVASRNGRLDVVRLLLDHGANVHANDDQALRFAAYNGHLNVVRLLLDRGANIHARDDNALRSADDHCHQDIVRLLLSRGANIDVLSPDLQITYRKIPIVLSQEEYQMVIPFIVSIRNNEITVSDRRKYIL